MSYYRTLKQKDKSILQLYLDLLDNKVLRIYINLFFIKIDVFFKERIFSSVSKIPLATPVTSASYL